MLTRKHVVVAASLALVACAQPVWQVPSGQNDSQGASTRPVQFEQPHDYALTSIPFIADLDGDGDLDLIGETDPDDHLSALYNRGDGSFAVDTAGSLPLGLVADLNGDGRADLVGPDPVTYGDLAVEIGQPGDAYSFVESPLPFDVTNAAWSAADMDGDGRPEIVAATDAGTYAIWTDKTGHVLSTKTLSDSLLHVAPDLDGDHRAELYQWGGASLSITISGTGKVWSTNLGCCDVGDAKFVDLDGDGVLDMVVGAMDRASGAIDAISFKGNGDGSFTREVTTVVGDGGFDDIVDIDGDGHPDIAFRSAHGSTEYFAMGDGAFGFTPSSYAAPLPELPRFVQFADMNGDGRADIVVSGELLVYVINSM